PRSVKRVAGMAAACRCPRRWSARRATSEDAAIQRRALLNVAPGHDVNCACAIAYEQGALRVHVLRETCEGGATPPDHHIAAEGHQLGTPLGACLPAGGLAAVL